MFNLKKLEKEEYIAHKVKRRKGVKKIKLKINKMKPFPQKNGENSQ